MNELNMSHGDDDLTDERFSSDVQPDSMQAYLQEIGRIPLLTAAQEVELAHRMADGQLATEVLQHNSASEEERAWAHRTKADGDAARRRMIEANLPLVVSIAKRYINRGLPLLDLIQEGNIGLIQAADKFDHRMGNRFSTYANPWIRHAVTRAIAEQSRIIRLPVHMSESVTQVRRISDQLSQTLGRAPTTQEIAVALGQPEDRIQQILKASRAPISLETPIGEDGDQTIGDGVPDEQSDPAVIYEQHEWLQVMTNAIEALPEHQRDVVRRRWGDRPQSQEEVARKWGKNRDWVRWREEKAKRSLRTALGEAA